jgi:chitin disaccharide deacetylase
MSRAARRSERPLMLCADDFGLSTGIDVAIEDLARRERLSAVSCLVNGPAWVTDGPAVARLPARVAAGLHFNLTEGRPLSDALAAQWPLLPALPQCLLAAHTRRLPLPAIAHELAAQWSAFVAATGRAPQFIDGHQHVHHLPGIRELVLDWAQRQTPPPALRSTGRMLGPGYALKRLVIEWTGGRALARRLERLHVAPQNSTLLGVYDFEEPDYRSLMQAWLARLPAEGGLIFCHPGRRSPEAQRDTIAAAREREWAYLASDAFIADLQAAGVGLTTQPA